MSIVTGTELRKLVNEDNKSLFTAGLVLNKVRESLQLITSEKKFVAVPRNHMEKYPHLADALEEFEEYSSKLTSVDFHDGWYVHLGALVAPWYRKAGNIHLYLGDRGLLSKSIKQVPDMNYDQRSSFFLNRVLGFDISDQRVKGKIHIHVFDVRDLTSPDVNGIRDAIAREHEGRGKYIRTCTFRAFGLRVDCPEGPKISSNLKDGPSLDFLAMNTPKWLQGKLSSN